MTLHARVADARERLVRAGIEASEAEIDARVLAEFALGWDDAKFLTDAVEAEPEHFAGAYEPLIARRISREPVAYITGVKEFWNLSFHVSPAVLIPRPETELIIEATLSRFGRERPLAIADVGTGSGCLAVALASEFGAASVVATDVSREALAIASANARRYGVSDRVQFIETDLLNGVTRRFDLIVSNPPYVPADEYETLQPEVHDYEPRLALVAADNGLGVIKKLVEETPARLESGAFLIFECGYRQDEAVRGLLSRTGWDAIEFLRDLQGIPRTAVARRAS